MVTAVSFLQVRGDAAWISVRAIRSSSVTYRVWVLDASLKCFQTVTTWAVTSSTSS